MVNWATRCDFDGALAIHRRQKAERRDSLDSGRGRYRFIFKDKKYLGLAIHEKSGAQYKYSWV